MRLKRWVVIGPSLKHGASGGVTRPFAEFCSFVHEEVHDVRVDIVELSLTPIGVRRIAAALLLGSRPDLILLHATWRSTLVLVPLLSLIGAIRRCRLVMRKFAGDFDLRWAGLNPVLRHLVMSSLRRFDAVYLETHYLVAWAEGKGCRARWWPNGRNTRDVGPWSANLPREGGSGPTKLVFLGRVCHDKGVFNLAAFGQRLGPGVHIDVWGPVDPKDGEAIHRYFMDHAAGISYRGELGRDRLYETLAGYDCLLLPTSWVSEGYPGVVIEAAIVGLPSIVTPSRGPSELVRHLKHGWVVDLRDRVQVDLSSTTRDRQELAERARAEFSAETLHRRVHDELISICS